MRGPEGRNAGLQGHGPRGAPECQQESGAIDSALPIGIKAPLHPQHMAHVPMRALGPHQHAHIKRGGMIHTRTIAKHHPLEGGLDARRPAAPSQPPKPCHRRPTPTPGRPTSQCALWTHTHTHTTRRRRMDSSGTSPSSRAQRPTPTTRRADSTSRARILPQVGPRPQAHDPHPIRAS